MFDQLDDPQGFTPSDAFRGAVRRRARHLVRRRRAGRVALAGVLPVVGLAAVAVGLDRRLDSVQRVEIGTSEADPLDTGAPVTILALGTDAAPNDPARARVEGTRSDVIVVVRIDPTHRRVSTLSIPRDLWTGEGKVGALEPAALTAWLGDHLDIHVDHLVSMDMEGFARLADRIEPRVRVDLPIRDRSTGLDLGAGCQVLDGDQALAYVRARHLQDLPGDPNSWRNDPTGDLGRIVRTQALVDRRLDPVRPPRPDRPAGPRRPPGGARRARRRPGHDRPPPPGSHAPRRVGATARGDAAGPSVEDAGRGERARAGRR